MQIERIMKFLKAVAANNNRDWFHEHKAEFDACKADFDEAVAELIAELSKFDATVANVTPKDAVYRFYRDVRFSADKSPYKRHFGAYISAKGKKSLHAGYYLHIQPGSCMISAGAYYLPTNILTSCRNAIMGDIDGWRKCVDNREFIHYFGYPNDSEWQTKTESGDDMDGISERGFGIARLKTCPAGFPRDYEHIEYLRMKDYFVWRKVDEAFFADRDWAKKAARILKVAKPMMDFTNDVIDDYE